MTDIETIKSAVRSKAIVPGKFKAFFKTDPGGYAEGDEFIGTSVPHIRKIAKDFAASNLEIVKDLLYSKFNEERLLSLFILVNQYKNADISRKQELYEFYLSHLNQVNNWNLVDSSAHLILGAHLRNKDSSLLEKLVKSPNLWERRIAIISTLYFIRKNELDRTFELAELLLQDKHDLIHKATGWMLREAGKKDQKRLIKFLDRHSSSMPRTMLRYSIEKFPEERRKAYLAIRKFI